MINALFKTLWKSYTKLNPDALIIHQEISQLDHFRNDHIALRTFAHPKIDINVMSQIFIDKGYEKKQDYIFETKHLTASHFEHSDNHPKVFISAFNTNTLSLSNQKIITACIDSITDIDELFINSGRTWEISHKKYLSLLAESEYAAWLYVFGFVTNHFTVYINDLASFDYDIITLNQWLKDKGYLLNEAGGEIKGSVSEQLEQSSTKAYQVTVHFTDGDFTVPSCYYEFAKRYPNSEGEIFQGFIAQSADKIFESTDI